MISEPESDEPVVEADVYKSGTLAARLTRTPLGIEFAYLDTYLDTHLDTYLDTNLESQLAAHPATRSQPAASATSAISAAPAAVATTLPLTRGATLTPAGAVPPFFAGLLPEGRRLTALRRRIKASADDELSLLVAVGLDTVGDVQVVRRGVAPSKSADNEPQLQNPREILFSDLLADDLPLDGVGLAGVQDKVSGKTIAVPVEHKGAETILKLSPPEYPHLVENEAYFLTLARRAGVACVDHSIIFDASDTPGLLVSRFDRQLSRNPHAIPVEDGCQVLGLWPADKYNTSMFNVISALTKLCAAELVAVRNAFRQVVFAVLTGNGDLHAKNLSVLFTDGEWMLSPAYDLPSTIIYGDSTLALPLGGKRRDISRRMLVEFAQTLGLSAKLAERVIDDVREATGDLDADLRAGALPFDQRTIDDTVAALRNRRRLLGG